MIRRSIREERSSPGFDEAEGEEGRSSEVRRKGVEMGPKKRCKQQRPSRRGVGGRWSMGGKGEARGVRPEEGFVGLGGCSDGVRCEASCSNGAIKRRIASPVRHPTTVQAKKGGAMGLFAIGGDRVKGFFVWCLTSKEEGISGFLWLLHLT
ncbi:unnamed protein product [Lactuca virosa]|uniref:Uncharacterized protein n=1 Tax=Lactuca virosa TaxID=75947 RepID=A0AAU9PNG6_9ASTR|nr:unnamed protein product [Lactuca virosa]